MKFLSDYTVIDIETTGLDARCSGITELAAVRVRGGEIVSRFQELSNPGVRIPKFLEEKTHITNEMVRCARPMREVLSSFLDFVGQDVLMGYNIDRFDKVFICEKAQSELAVRFEPRTFDIFPLARQAFRRELRSFRLDALREALGINSEGSHRALKDCCDTFYVYCQIKDRLNDSFPSSEYFSYACCRPSPKRRSWECVAIPNDLQIRDQEIMQWIPLGFSPVMKPYVPTNYRERWNFVARHPFQSLAGAIVSITGSSPEMPRLTAENVVARLGATLKSSTVKTCDFCIVLGGDTSGKIADAKRWKEKGSPIRIIGVQDFIGLIKATVAEPPLMPETVAKLENEVAVERERVKAAENELSERIKKGIKKRVSDEELHCWRQEFSLLWNRILEDDIIEPHEVYELREWLLNHMRKRTDYRKMFELMDCVLADGVVDYDESLKLFDAAEKCLETMGAKKAQAEELGDGMQRAN